MNGLQVYSRLPFQPLAARSSELWSRVVCWLASKKEAHTKPRKLYIAERASVGEKSFVSVVHVDGRRFLLASTAGSVSLLTELSPEATFGEAMHDAVIASASRVSKPRPKRAAKKVAVV